MTVSQQPVEVAEFTHWLTGLTARLRPDAGWYGVFAARDPEGLRACLDGTELLPWDVVSSLLQDAGESVGGPFAVRGRTLYAAAALAHDRRPGAAAALAERRELMERERRYAESRARELLERLRAVPGPDPEEAARLERDLAWTHDDRARAVSRVAELTARLAGTGERGRGPVLEGGAPAGRARVSTAAPTSAAGLAAALPPTPADWAATTPSTPDGRAATASAASPLPAAAPPAFAAASPPPVAAASSASGPPAFAPASPAPPAPASPTSSAPPTPVPPAKPERSAKAGKAGRRPRGARYAWLEEGDEAREVVPAPEPVPVLPAGGAAPRGARFGGAAGPEGPGGGPAAGPAEDPAEAARAAANAVYALRRLRARGRSGEAHVLLCEALGGPPARLPALADELHRAGLDADWATLLWEAASLPPDRLAAVAGVLADAGRAADCEQLLRQGVARPVEELAGACAALHAEEHHREAHALLTAFVRVRAPEDAARLAGVDPRGLVPQLLDAARAVSGSRERDLLHAFRVAGLAGV
ncbi:UL36 very large tegument protein [Streptomyces sp. NPDC012950]|uniref:UL36 very large tegument protein n=1 Tax=Streptomyces sp. NPDC012950 TaxID=3364858 RepID=UPI0036A75E12